MTGFGPLQMFTSVCDLGAMFRVKERDVSLN